MQVVAPLTLILLLSAVQSVSAQTTGQSASIFGALPEWLSDLVAREPEGEPTKLPYWFPRILGAQATIIDQGVLPFHSPYRDANSFKANGDNQISQTYGLYLGSQPTRRLHFYFDVEMWSRPSASRSSSPNSRAAAPVPGCTSSCDAISMTHIRSGTVRVASGATTGTAGRWPPDCR